MYRLFLLLVLGALLGAVETPLFSSTQVKNGETILVTHNATDGVKPLALYVDKKRLKFFNHPYKASRYYLFIPIHYNSVIGRKKVEFEYLCNGKKARKSLKPIQVIWGRYKKEKLSVDPRKIWLSESDRKRVEKEYVAAQKIYNHEGLEYYPKKRFIEPMQSRLTSFYGNERLFNNERRGYHTGVDYRAKTPQPVKAAASGKVVLVDNRFYAGNTVMVDHGQGIISVYCHLSRFDVNKGDQIERGTIVGLTGATGRVTGPHLHFSMKLHGVSVNPLKLMKQLNGYMLQ